MLCLWVSCASPWGSPDRRRAPRVLLGKSGWGWSGWECVPRVIRRCVPRVGRGPYKEFKVNNKECLFPETEICNVLMHVQTWLFAWERKKYIVSKKMYNIWLTYYEVFILISTCMQITSQGLVSVVQNQIMQSWQYLYHKHYLQGDKFLCIPNRFRHLLK